MTMLWPGESSVECVTSVCVCVCGFWGVEEYVYRCVYIEVRECGCRVVEEWLRLG